MQRQCVIIERLTSCPPISHLGHLLPLQLNAPRKWDKIVINAKSLCLLSCSEKGQCYWPHACSKGVNKKKRWIQGWNKSLLLQWDQSSASVSIPLGCVCLKTGHVTPIVNCLHCLHLVPLFPCFQCLYPELQILKQVQKEIFKEKTISQSQWHDSVSDRVVMPHSHPHPLLCVYSVVL